MFTYHQIFQNRRKLHVNLTTLKRGLSFNITLSKTFSRVLSCSLFVALPNNPPHSPPLPLPLSTTFYFSFCFVLFWLCSRSKRAVGFIAQREESWKLASTSSLSLSCHNGVSKDKLLQPVNRTKQKMQCPSISDSNNLWPNAPGSSKLCWNELCPSL